MANEQDEVIVDDVEENNEEEGVAEEKPAKADKPKRTPQEELVYFEGRANRLKKQLGIDKVEPTKSTPTDKPSELDLGGIAYLASMMQVKGKDEIALAREYITAGKSILD